MLDKLEVVQYLVAVELSSAIHMVQLLEFRLAYSGNFDLLRYNFRRLGS